MTETMGKRRLLENIGKKSRGDVRIPEVKRSVVIEVGNREPLSRCDGCDTDQPDVYSFNVGNTKEDAAAMPLCRTCVEKKYVGSEDGRGYVGPIRSDKIDERI